MSDCVRAGEVLSSAREATTPRPSSRGLRLFPIRSRIICGMGGALRGSRTILGLLQCPGNTVVEGVCGKRTMGVLSLQHLVQAVAILWCRELVSFVYREPHVGPPCPLAVGAMESAGPEKKWM